MSFRFWRRIRLAPGITLNLSKSTASLSFGPRGAKYTISPRGNRVTVGLPGTGLFYTVRQPGSVSAPGVPPAAPVRSRLKPGFFRRLTLRAEDRAMIDGLRAMVEGDESSALAHLERALMMADAAWLAGMLRLKREDFERAGEHLERALQQADALGRHFAHYELSLRVALPVTAEVTAHAAPDKRSTLLALVEAAQFQGHTGRARAYIDALIALDPADPIALVSMGELLLDMQPPRDAIESFVTLTAQVGNDTPIHTALLLYRARALARLALPAAAIDTLTLALRRRKDRDEALLRQLRYERAVLYQHVGRTTDARREFERLYGEAPDFADLAQRLMPG